MDKKQLKEIIENKNIKDGDIVNLYLDDGSVWVGKCVWKDVEEDIKADKDIKSISINRKGFPREDNDKEPGEMNFPLNKIENILKYQL